MWRLCLARSRAPGALGRRVADWPGHLLCVPVGEASSSSRDNPRRPMQTGLMLAILILAGALGDVSLAKGMKQVGAVHTLRWRALLVLGRKMVRNGAILLGLLCMITGFLTFVVLLSWADLSFIVPATSLHFVLVTLGAKWIL